MRKIVNYIKLNSNVDKYLFKGVSLMDIQKFVNQLQMHREKVMIYQDIPQISEYEQMPLNKVKYVNSIKRRTKRFYTGNDCIIITDTKRINIFRKSCNEIFYSVNEVSISKKILLMAYFHDINWQSIIIFNDIELKKEFFNFVKNYSQLILELDIEVFYD